MEVSLTTAVVSSLVSSIAVVAAFEYDKWRGEDMKWFERILTQILFTLISILGIFFLAHGRLRFGKDIFYSPIHTSACIGRLCYQKSS